MRRRAVLLGAFLLTAPASSQRFDTFAVPHSGRVILETSEGFWVPLRNEGEGIALFDLGTPNVTTFGVDTLPGYPPARPANALCESTDGSVWSGTHGGFLLRRGVGESTFRALRSLDQPNISAVGCRSNGEVWALVGARAFRYAPDGTALGEFTDPAVSWFGYGGICGCPTGELWMLAKPTSGTGSIARLSASGRFDFFTRPSYGVGEYSDMTCASDGGLWYAIAFVDEVGRAHGGRIGRIFPEGRIVEFDYPYDGSGPVGVVEGPDGAAWFTAFGLFQLGRVDEAGRFSFFSDGFPRFGWDMLLGRDGNIWYVFDGLTRFTLPAYRQTVPAVVGTSGVGGVTFTTDLSVTNWGSSPATLTVRYVPSRPSSGSSDASVTEVLPPGRQLLLDDALAWFRSKGFSIPPTGNVGTVSVEATSALPWHGVSALARTTSPSGPGRSGVSYPAWPAESLPSGPGRTLSLFGLRQTTSDRTNLALVNTSPSASVRLRVSLVPASGSGSRVVFPAVSLSPGGWTQLDSLLLGTGLTEAWAEVESVGAEEAAFGAYAVVNDAATSDGSFLAPQEPSADLVLPALVDTGAYRTELLLANPGAVSATAELTFVPAQGPAATATVTLAPSEQRIVPDAARNLGLGSGVGGLFVRFTQGSGVASGRVATPEGHGVFLPAVSRAGLTASKVRVAGLRQGNGVRSNLAFVNADETPITLKVTLVDGETGARQPSSTVELQPRGFEQLNLVLLPSGLRHGWAEVERLSPSGRFLAYGVVNDGERQGEGTGDGSFLPMATER